MGANVMIPLFTLLVVLVLIKVARIEVVKDELKFIKHCVVPKKFEITGRIARIYDGDKVLVISSGEGSQIVNSSLIPIYYADVVDVDNKMTTIEIKDFGFVGKLIRKIDELDKCITLPCRQYSFNKYPFVA